MNISNKYQIYVDATLDPAASAKLQQQIEAVSQTASNVATNNSLSKTLSDWGTKFNTFSAIINNVKYGLQSLTQPVFDLNAAQVELNKVTDLTASQLERLTEQAAEAGIRVARTAADTLGAIYEFSKSGYNESDALMLGEIALLYSNVADEALSAADSASFIISQMKAFNITAEESIHIIDAVNEVSNNFAVSSSDIATALTKTSAAMAVLGNNFEETIALVVAGTEVMTGQASKVARGLRTIGNNIADLANKSGELEYVIGGVTTTINLLDDATGDLKSTFQILEEIYVNGWENMSNAEQQALAISLAGKNQIEVFSSVLSNFGTAIGAAETAIYSAGSAAEENAKYLDSLEAAVTGFKAAWEKLINSLISSNLVKTIINLGTSIVKLADSDIGKLVIQLTALVVGFKLAGAAINVLKGQLGLYALGVTAATGATTVFQTVVGGLILKVEALGAVIKANPILFATGAVITGITLVKKAIDNVSVSFEEQTEKVQSLTNELNSLESEYSALASNDNRSDAQEKRLQQLEAEIELRRQILALEAQEAYKLFQQENTSNQYLTEGAEAFLSIFTGNALALATQGFDDVTGSVELLNQQIIAAKRELDNFIVSSEADLQTQTQLKERYSELLTTRAGYLNQLITERDLLAAIVSVGGELTPEQETRLELLNDLIYASAEASEALEGVVDSEGELEDQTSNTNSELLELIDTLDALAGSLSVAESAYNEFNKNGELSYSTLSKIANKFSEVDGIETYIAALASADLTAEQLTQILSELTVALLSQEIEAGNLTSEHKALIIKMLEEVGVTNAAEIAAFLLTEQLHEEEAATDDARGAIEDFNENPMDTTGKISNLNNLVGALNKVAEAAAKANSALGGEGGNGWKPGDLKYTRGTTPTINTTPTVNYGGTSSGGGGKGGGGGGSTKEEPDPVLVAIEARLALLKSELSLLEKSGAHDNEIVAKMRELQQTLHEQANYYRDLGEEDNQELINKLSGQWWDYQNKIAKIQEDIYKEALKAIDDMIQAELDAIDKQIDELKKYRENTKTAWDDQISALKEANKELERQISLEEKLDALARAKEARLYVYKDGVFQYVQDLDAISKAQADYDDLVRKIEQERELERLQAERDAALAAIDKEIEKLNNQKNTLKDEQTAAKNGDYETWRIIQQMQQNSSKWHTADEQLRKDLHNWNLALGESIGASYDSNSGKWDYGGVGDYAKPYALGTKSSGTEIAMTGEHGRELQVLTRGDSVIPNNLTENLWELGQYKPLDIFNTAADYANKMIDGTGNSYCEITIGNVDLPNVKDAEQFINDILNIGNKAAQQSSTRH